MEDTAWLLPSSAPVLMQDLKVARDQNTGMKITGGDHVNATYHATRSYKSHPADYLTLNESANVPLIDTTQIEGRARGCYLECYVPMIYQPRLYQQVIGTWRQGHLHDNGGRASRHLFDVSLGFKMRIVLHPGRHTASQQGPDDENGWVHTGLSKQPSLYTDPQAVRVLVVEVLDMGGGTRDLDPAQFSEDQPHMTDEGKDVGIAGQDTPQYHLFAPTEYELFHNYAHASFLGEPIQTTTGSTAVPVGRRAAPRSAPAGDTLTTVGEQLMVNRRLLSYTYKRKNGDAPWEAGKEQVDQDMGRTRKFNVLKDYKVIFGPPSVTTGGRIATTGGRVWEKTVKINVGRVSTPDNSNADQKMEGATKRIFVYFMPTCSSYINGRRIGTSDFHIGDMRSGTHPGTGHHDFSVQLTKEWCSYREWTANGMAG